MREEIRSMATKQLVPALLILAMVLISLVTTGEAAAAAKSCTGNCKKVCKTIKGADNKICSKACNKYCTDVFLSSKYESNSWNELRDALDKVILGLLQSPTP